MPKALPTKLITTILFTSAIQSFAGSIPAHEVINDLTGIDVGTLTIGGCIRANYVRGDYADDGTDRPQRGGNGGSVELDVFRLNVDWEKENWIGATEYRWYNNSNSNGGYHFLHHAWLGYNFDEESQVKVGLNRVPFGVGAYGPANSWFFDQHFYVGLADDMDLGVKYTRTMDNLTLDLAYYAAAEPNGNGATDDSARYSYDVVDTGDAYSHYRERNQFNVRLLQTISTNSIPTELGISLQLGQLVAGDHSMADDTISYAASVHSSSTLGAWNLKLQLTQYDYRPDYNDPAQTDDLITMGAYDYAAPVASKGVIPSAALSYTVKPAYEWMDSITFYNDFSVIIKDGKDTAGTSFNDSAMNVIGASIASGGWYTQIDYAYANGNYFAGPNGDFGENDHDEWEGRFNVNIGYYF